MFNRQTSFLQFIHLDRHDPQIFHLHLQKTNVTQPNSEWQNSEEQWYNKQKH